MATSVKLSDNNYWCGYYIYSKDRSDHMNLDDFIIEMDAGIAAPVNIANGKDSGSSQATGADVTITYQKTMSTRSGSSGDVNQVLIFCTGYGGTCPNNAGRVAVYQNKIEQTGTTGSTKGYVKMANSSDQGAFTLGCMWMAFPPEAYGWL